MSTDASPVDSQGPLHGDDPSPWISTGLDAYRLEHNALPGFDRDDVATGVTLLGRPLSAPLVIALASEGRARSPLAARTLVGAAQAARVAIDVGTVPDGRADRDAIRDLRDVAPDIPLIVSVPILQLDGVDAPAVCADAAAVVQADAVVIRTVPVAEVLDPGRVIRFSRMRDVIASVATALDIPVLVGETGHGIGRATAAMLSETGIAGIDTGGRGGRRREPGQRTDDPVLDRVITEFADWGLSTAESVVQSRAGFPDGLVIASGGLRSGVDVAIAMALGADATGIGVPLSRAAQVSRHAVEDRLRAITESLRIAMLLTGARDVAALQSATLLPRLPT